MSLKKSENGINFKQNTDLINLLMLKRVFPQKKEIFDKIVDFHGRDLCDNFQIQNLIQEVEKTVEKTFSSFLENKGYKKRKI